MAGRSDSYNAQRDRLEYNRFTNFWAAMQGLTMTYTNNMGSIIIIAFIWVKLYLDTSSSEGATH